MTWHKVMYVRLDGTQVTRVLAADDINHAIEMVLLDELDGIDVTYVSQIEDHV